MIVAVQFLQQKMAISRNLQMRNKNLHVIF